MKKTFFPIALCIAILAMAFFLRVYKLSTLPPSLYWEEVALGYDAYSILKTGKDHHGQRFPLVAFTSFGDYKPSMYFYAATASIAVFDLNEFSVRLPSVLAGLSTVLGVGLLAREIFDTSHQKKFKRESPKNTPIFMTAFFIALFLTTISPWSILFSRAAWESNLATAFITYGVLFGLKSWNTTSQKKLFLFLLLSSFFFVISMYTYHSCRVIAPLLGLAIATRHLYELRKNFSSLLLAGMMSIFLLLPLLLSLRSNTVTQRFNETSIFSEVSIVEESNLWIAEDGGGLVASIIHHRYLFFGEKILNNFFSHFTLRFLFINGDINPRHSIQFIGHLYYIDAVFLAAGALFLLRRRNQYDWFLLVWMIVSVIPASLSQASPHSLRILPVMPVFLLIITAGVKYCYDSLSTEVFKKIFISLFLTTYLLFFGTFWHFYSQVYPKLSSKEWQYGYKEMITAINTFQKPEEKIIIGREYGRPMMYYWFFNKTNPQSVQTIDSVAKKDQNEFLEYDRVKIANSLSGDEKGIIASSPERMRFFPQAQLLAEIKDFTNTTIWVVYRNE